MDTNQINTLFKRGLSGLKKLTDSTGLIQHSHFSVPDPKHGYSLDDNARALVVSLLAKEFDLAQIYLSFLRHGQSEEGRFSNFLSYKREWLGEPSLGDSFGRAVWALCFCVAKSPLRGLTQSAGWMFEKAYANIANLQDLRSIAFSISGLGYLLKERKFEVVSKTKSGLEKDLESLTEKLVEAFKENSEKSWEWFENLATYENARLPQALLVSYKHLKKEEYLKIAEQATAFLIKNQWDPKEGYFNFIGQDGWFEKGKEKALFDQQPVESGSTVKLLVDAYQITGKKEYLDLAFLAFDWFRGKNIKKESLIDNQTGRIHDGINREGVNQNEGAESLVSFLLACHSLIKIN